VMTEGPIHKEVLKAAKFLTEKIKEII
jgi:hypothetical protein